MFSVEHYKRMITFGDVETNEEERVKAYFKELPPVIPRRNYEEIRKPQSSRCPGRDSNRESRGKRYRLNQPS
jgi:hypothetical protein